MPVGVLWGMSRRGCGGCLAEVVGDVSQRLWRNALDKTVGRIFGFAIRPTTTQRQQRLFEVYVEMIEKDQLFPRTAERKTQRKS